jgi:hypothetical protein
MELGICGVLEPISQVTEGHLNLVQALFGSDV